MRKIAALKRLRRSLNELSKALGYRTGAPFHIPVSLLPFDFTGSPDAGGLTRAYRLVSAYFGYHGIHVYMSYGENADAEYGPLVGLEGNLFPLRPEWCSFSSYEMAIVFIRDGADIEDAFASAYMLDLP